MSHSHVAVQEYGFYLLSHPSLPFPLRCVLHAPHLPFPRRFMSPPPCIADTASPSPPLTAGYSGGANLPILDQFHTSPLRFVMNRSEQCCGHAAEGYARSSGKVGVVLTTSGPGLTNIITPLQDARGDSTPIVALSGQVPTSAVGTDAFQECLAVDLTKPCTKWSYQVMSPPQWNQTHTKEPQPPINTATSRLQAPTNIFMPSRFYPIPV